jgi:D-ribulokinase
METVIGIDLGTQGVRCLAVNAKGTELASAQQSIKPTIPGLPDGWVEQDANDWWRATAHCLRELLGKLPPSTQIVAVSVDSTSGTVLPIDVNGEPLHAALMYNDSRSAGYVPQVRQESAALESQLGYAFNASFALPKIIWLQRECPDVRTQVKRFIHAADFIVGKLCGNYEVSDYSNALKTGYDLINNRWPSFIEEQLGIATSQLPLIIAPGQAIDLVSAIANGETGLPSDCMVIAGATDGTAAQIASGAVDPGAWNSSLGTTLVIKGITRQLLHDPQQRIYSHRHPEGWWMPGGASNTGCEWIMREYVGQDLRQLDAIARTQLPTPLIRYPLARTGERFPFLKPRATGFAIDDSGASVTSDHAMYYAAGLEGTAMLERLAYETLTEIGATVGERIHVTGGGSKSSVWLTIRASVLGRQLIRPRTTETAMGAALLAASGSWYRSLGEAARAMITSDLIVEPDPLLMNAYNDRYFRFRRALVEHDYLLI